MRLEQPDVALAVAPEVEVLADDDDLHGERLDEHALDELVGQLLGLRDVERHDHRASTPVAASSSRRCSGDVSSCGADSGRTIVAGWRSNVSTTERAPSALGEAADVGDDGLVTEVHAVVGADRDDGALAGPGRLIDIGDDLHGLRR